MSTVDPAFWALAGFATTCLLAGLGLMKGEPGLTKAALVAFVLSVFFAIAAAARHFDWAQQVFFAVCIIAGCLGGAGWYLWPAAPPPEITLVALGQYAQNHCKWDFSAHTSGVADFQRALLNAAAKGADNGGLQFLGKSNDLTYPEYAKGEFTTEIISPGHFTRARFNLGQDFPTQSNFNTQTVIVLGAGGQTYRDLEVSDGKKAMAWVRKIGSSRGNSAIAHRIEDEERKRVSSEREERWRTSETKTS